MRWTGPAHSSPRIDTSDGTRPPRQGVWTTTGRTSLVRVATSRGKIETLRTRVRVAAGITDGRDGYRWNRLAHPQRGSDWFLHKVRATIEGLRFRQAFDHVEKYCFFVGYQRSGHSLIGSLLNAHPDIVIAHELGAIPYIEHGFTRDQLFSALLRRDRDFASLGRKWTGYEYAVANQHQGSFHHLRVIGDKFGGITAVQLAARPELLDGLRRTVGVPLRVLHVTRNPFDNITTLSHRMHTSIAQAASRYAQLSRSVNIVMEMLKPGELLNVDYDAFVAAPSSGLTEICRFLEVEVDPSYLRDCSAVVWPRTRRTRDSAEWSMDDVAAVQSLLDTYPTLRHYSFDD